MSFDINPLQGPSARMAPVSRSASSQGSGATTSAHIPEAVTVDVGSTIPASPPAEVYDAMGVAANAHAQLAAQDRGLSFKIDEATGKVIVSVHDNAGKVLFTVPTSKALDIASGGSLDQ